MKQCYSKLLPSTVPGTSDFSNPFMLHQTVSEETCNEVESLVFDLFANLGATGAVLLFNWVSLKFFLFFL